MRTKRSIYIYYNRFLKRISIFFFINLFIKRATQKSYETFCGLSLYSLILRGMLPCDQNRNINIIN